MSCSIGRIATIRSSPIWRGTPTEMTCEQVAAIHRELAVVGGHHRDRGRAYLAARVDHRAMKLFDPAAGSPPENPDWLFELYGLVRIFPALAERVAGQCMLDGALEVSSAEWLPQQLVGATLE